MGELESLRKREGAIQERYQDRIDAFEKSKVRTDETKSEYSEKASAVEMLANSLSDLSEQLDEAKDLMAEHSGRVEDSSPVVKLKEGVQKMKAENVSLSLRIGVAKQLLAQKQVAAKRDGLNPIA